MVDELFMRAERCACLLAALWFVAFIPGATRAQELSPAPGGRVVNLTRSAGYFNEPSIAVNPNNPRQLTAAYQVNASVAHSEDEGRTWQLASGTAPSDYRVSGDVSITYDNRGHAILCYIAFDRLGTHNYWGHNATRNGVFIRRSLDGGKTWEKNAVPVIQHDTAPGIPFEDKPYIVADNTQGPYAGNLYVGWTQFTLSDSVILFSRSTDGGQSWSAPIRISTHAGLPRDDNGSVEGFTGAVAADGTLSVTWADGAHIAFTSSHDGGRSFEPSRNIVDVAAPYFEVFQVSRANGFPEIGVDPRPDQGGRLFVIWSDYRNGDIDVFSATSADGGRSWSEPVRVNSDSMHNGNDQFFQWLAVDPQTGAANVIFYDRRGDPGNRETRVTLARSTDGGRSFANYAWTSDGFTSSGDFLGDYTAIAAWGGRVYGVWAEEVSRKAKPGTHATVVRVGVAEFTK